MSGSLEQIFSYAFRPFFLLVGTYAVAMVSAWALFLGGVLRWPGSGSPFIHHGHEMIFGFAGAAIAGFLLTAVATWTGRPPVRGRTLMLLSAAWLIARLGGFAPGTLGSALWAMASIAFWLALVLLMAREVYAVRNIRNYKAPMLLLAFTVAEGIFFAAGPEHTETREACLRAGLFLVLGMISLVGGRILPAFTQNWLRCHRPDVTVQLPGFDRFDQIAVGLMTLFGVAFVLAPEATTTGWLAVSAAMIHAVRLLRWRGWLTVAEPLLWILHVGYAWIPAGFALLGLAVFGEATSRDAGLHALGYGAVGSLILGVAARVALGHTGRPLTAGTAMRWAFVLITLGAIGRVLAVFTAAGLWLSAACWIAAYGLFLVRYTPILLQPRVDGKP